MTYTVITGASSGIGYEAALAFARKEKNLILVARRSGKLDELKQTIKEINNELDVVLKVCDLSDKAQVYELYDQLKEYDVETWINNAGLGDASLVAKESLDKVETMLKVNVEALTILSTLYAQDYIDKEKAQLINVSSAMGYMIALGNVAYSATKYYVSAFTEGLAMELIGHPLKAKILAPAITATEFVDKATNSDNFNYETGVNHFHTAKEMAMFLIKLYESDQTLGIVDDSFEFRLREGVFPVLGSV